MNNILIEEKYLLEYIRDTINSFKYFSREIDNAKYHHNSSYSNAVSICKYGILTLSDMARMGIGNYSKDLLNKMSDIESHANGIDAVSLSTPYLQDLNPDEFEYNPFSPHLVDFLVSSDLRVGRYSKNYGNEFLSYSSIDLSKLRAVDIRLLSLIKLIESKEYSQRYTAQELIDKYNYLKEIALTMKHHKLDIPLREMSDENNNGIDIDKTSNTPRLVLKKK